MNVEPNHRASVRFETALHVAIGPDRGTTRNISRSGIYLETTTAPKLGAGMHFTVEVTEQGRKFNLACEGTAHRIDQKMGTVGIAVKLAQPFFVGLIDCAGSIATVEPGRRKKHVGQAYTATVPDAQPTARLKS